MKEAPMTLLGFTNPMGEIYPAIMVAIVSTPNGIAEVYSDGTAKAINTVLENLLDTHLLKPNLRFPFRNNGRDEFLYAISKDQVLVGDRDSVVKSLRFHLNTLSPSSVEFTEITEFINHAS